MSVICWPRSTSAALTMPFLSARGLVGSYSSTPAGLPRAMPVTATPLPVLAAVPLLGPVPAAVPASGAVITKRAW